MQKRKTKPRTVPLPPPYEEAMHALRELELRSLIAQGLVREHVFRLSDILKRYIERRFNINAQEFTTEEIVLWLRTSALPREVRRHVEQFFADSDPVKYAKWLPANSALVAMTAQVRTFVEESRPAAEPQPAPPGPSPDASADTTQQECSHGV